MVPSALPSAVLPTRLQEYVYGSLSSGAVGRAYAVKVAEFTGRVMFLLCTETVSCCLVCGLSRGVGVGSTTFQKCLNLTRIC